MVYSESLTMIMSISQTLRRASVGGCMMAVAATALVSAPLMAQTEANPERRRRRPDARSDSRTEIRVVRALQKAVAETIELSEAQARVIGDLFDTYRERTQETVRQIEKGRDANRQRAGELRRQLVEARKASDRERMRELRTEMREMSAGRLELQRAQREFDDRIVAELTEEQVGKYRGLAARIRGQAGAASGPFRGIATIRRTLRQLDLSEEQEQRVRDVMRSVAGAFAERNEDSSAGDALDVDFRKQVMEILTPEQRARLTELETEAPATLDRGREARPGAAPGRPKRGDGE